MKEYILCAAIWYQDLELPDNTPKELLPINCDKGIVVLGHRHGQCIWTMLALKQLRTIENGDSSVGKHVQGFLTNKNRFVDRQEGGIIAFNAGQIKTETECLFSEDLY